VQVADENATEGETSTPPAGQTPAPATPTPVPIPDDTPAVVSTFLTAVDTEDYSTQSAITSGPARALTRVRDIIRQENTRRGAKTDNVVTTSEQPRQIDRTDQRATVAVKANIVSTVSGDQGTQRSEASVDGPVTLVRTGDHWTVDDFVYAGRRLGEAYFPVDVRQTVSGVRLEVALFVSYKETTAAVVRFVNEEEGGVRLGLTKIELTAADGRVLAERQVVPEPKETPAIFLGFERVDGKPKALRIEVHDDASDRNWSYNVTF
jgi:hypothetical protein